MASGGGFLLRAGEESGWWGGRLKVGEEARRKNWESCGIEGRGRKFEGSNLLPTIPHFSLALSVTIFLYLVPTHTHMRPFLGGDTFLQWQTPPSSIICTSAPAPTSFRNIQNKERLESRNAPGQP